MCGPVSTLQSLRLDLLNMPVNISDSCHSFTSLLTAEPEPWLSEQDVYITGTEQDNDETGITALQPNTGRRCQAVHALPHDGHLWQHYIDWFDTEGTTPVLGLATRWIKGSVFNKL